MEMIEKCNICKVYLIDDEISDIMICHACQIRFYLNQILNEISKIPIIRKITNLINERR